MKATLRQLQYVRTAANCRSIVRAAEQLHISQSSIGSAINLVEQEFGICIFVRQRSKGLTPTKSGQHLIHKISELLSDADSFASEAIGLKNRLTGELNVGCFAPLTPLVLPPIMKDLTHKHPGVSVHLHEGHLLKVQRLLLDGFVDVVLTYDLGLSNRISSSILGKAPPYVVLSTDDPLGNREVVSLEDLTDRPMILLDLPESRTYFELIFESMERRPKIAHRTESYEMVRALVAAGFGFSLLNLRPLIDQTYIGESVVCRPLADKVIAPNFILGRRKEDFSVQLVEAFAESCRKYFESPQAANHVVGLQGIFAAKK